MSPETIGLSRAENDVGVVLGKLSGRNALNTKLRELGYELTEDALSQVFRRFKALCDSKKRVYDEDLIALVGDEIGQVRVPMWCPLVCSLAMWLLCSACLAL